MRVEFRGYPPVKKHKVDANYAYEYIYQCDVFITKLYIEVIKYDN